MKNSTAILPRLLFGLLAVSLLTVPCAAAAPDPGAGFYVKALTPENQRDPQAAYFDLLTEPGQKQILYVEIVNPSEEEITVSVETVTASTNRNGIINYSTPGIYDDSMQCSFAEIAEPVEDELVIPPFSSRQAEVAVQMPEEPFSGMLLGSIRVVKQIGEQESADEAMGIVNQYSYTIGVRLTQERDGAEIEPAFSLGEVGGATVNYRAAVVADIRNMAPVIARDLVVVAKVFRKGEQSPLIEKTQQAVDMAPNSVFPMSLVDEAGYGFEEGEYIAVVDLAYGEQSWGFEQEFTIEPQVAEAMNGAAVNQQQNQQPREERAGSVWVVVGVALCCCAAGAVLALRVLGRRKAIHR